MIKLEKRTDYILYELGWILNDSAHPCGAMLKKMLNNKPKETFLRNVSFVTWINTSILIPIPKNDDVLTNMVERCANDFHKRKNL